MSTLNDILKQIKTDIESYIDPSNTSSGGYRYKTAIKDVKRGVYGSDECNQLPTVVYRLDYEERYNEMGGIGGNGIRKMFVYVYAFIQTKTYKNDETACDSAHDLLEDLKKFFYHDFTYKDSTEISTASTSELGLKYPLNLVELNVEILYNYII
jgi:hypothetical protein